MARKHRAATDPAWRCCGAWDATKAASPRYRLKVVPLIDDYAFSDIGIVGQVSSFTLTDHAR
jgi:hypothetical protein